MNNGGHTESRSQRDNDVLGQLFLACCVGHVAQESKEGAVVCPSVVGQDHNR